MLEAAHIIGGVMTYECLGNGDYEFDMRLYRDCNCNNCAAIDGSANIAIYRCGSDRPCSSLSEMNASFEFIVANRGTLGVPNAEQSCLVIPPDVCVESGNYRWKLSDLGINLPNSSDSYFVVYQRCCRNETINNLNRPSEQGLTIAVEITPFGQRECNSSPVFNEFPPTIICAGQSIDFDHSATDPDGDFITYEFCSPFSGGGNARNGPSCSMPRPNPPCPPPYTGINYRAPFTAQEPMGGDPLVTIDPNTGFISGIPQLQGQFVVGVCATEFRNGFPIGRIIRDFQFNVGNCDALIDGIIDADEIIDNGDIFVINSCGDLEVDFINNSDQTFVDEFFWEFDFNDGTTQRIDEWSPTVEFPSIGAYEGALFLNPNSECGDTAFITVNVFSEPTANFEFDYDTCEVSPVNFVNNSFSPDVNIVNHQWDFGDGNSSNQSDPNHLFSESNNYPVNLLIEDSNGCFDAMSLDLPYFPVPRFIVISPSADEGCVPYEVFFDNLSSPIDETYDILWDFGDGQTGDDISPTHIYNEPGRFSVSVEIISPLGCFTDTFFNDLIFIDEAPIANFSFSPERVTTLNSTVEFTNESANARFFNWNFNDEFQTIFENPSYTFEEPGIHFVRLIAVHETGCQDTVEYSIDVLPHSSFFLPNAFTPNNDSTNDLYKGVGDTRFISEFEMKIINRWGEIIFTTTDPNEGWNGQKNNIGEPVPHGVYQVLARYLDGEGNLQEVQGMATVVR